MTRLVSQEELEHALEQWQKRLRLQDWEVEVRLCHRSEISDGCVASVDRYYFTRTALIKIGLPDEWTSGDSEIQRDWETNLVHELIHLVWLDYEKADGPKFLEIAEERACNDLAAALVGLKRLANEKGAGIDES